jgi:hypothetical protein
LASFRRWSHFEIRQELAARWKVLLEVSCRPAMAMKDTIITAKADAFWEPE